MRGCESLSVLDLLDGIATTMQRVTADPAPKQYRISDLIPRNWEGSNDKGEIRQFMSDLHLWMQAWSGEGGTMRVSVESTEKLGSSKLAVDCSDAEL